MNYKNQKRIEIKNFNSILHKENTNEQFLRPIDWKYYDAALNNLSGNTFKLWFYLLRWSGKGYYDFSPVNLCNTLNIGSKNTVRAMKDELVEKKYLIHISENLYYFYPEGYN